MLFQISGLYRTRESANYYVVEGYQRTKLVATLKKFYGRHHNLVTPYNVTWLFPESFLMSLLIVSHSILSEIPGHTFYPTLHFLPSRPIGMVVEAC